MRKERRKISGLGAGRGAGCRETASQIGFYVNLPERASIQTRNPPCAGSKPAKGGRPKRTNPATAFSAVFRSSLVARDAWRRWGPGVAHARGARDNPEFSGWRPENESPPKLACVPGSADIQRHPRPTPASSIPPMYSFVRVDRLGIAVASAWPEFQK